MITVLPMGNIFLHYLEKAKEYVEKVYKEDVKIVNPVNFPEECFNEERNQYDAVCVLDFIPYPEEGKIVGLCDKDLYVRGLNFVFGIAEGVGGKRCVVSIARLREGFYRKKEDEEVFILRMAKEINHEIGHLKGLKHCRDKKCVMHFSNSIYDTDFKDYKLCERCKRRIFR